MTTNVNSECPETGRDPHLDSVCWCISFPETGSHGVSVVKELDFDFQNSQTCERCTFYVLPESKQKFTNYVNKRPQVKLVFNCREKQDARLVCSWGGAVCPILDSVDWMQVG